MTLHDRLRQLAAALPSDDSAVTFTRSDLVALLDREAEPSPALSSRDLSVEEVAEEVARSASSVRSWLTSGALEGYKLRGKAWRVPRAALRAFLDGEAASPEPEPPAGGSVDITDWRKLRGAS